MGAVFSGAGYLGSITNVDMSNNYYDPTHATTVWAVWSSGGPGTGYGTTFTATGNINMVTGNPAPAHPTP